MVSTSHRQTDLILYKRVREFKRGGRVDHLFCFLINRSLLCGGRIF